MPQKRLLPPTPELIRLITGGWKVADIAAQYKVSTSAVNRQIRNYRRTARLAWPWEICPRHKAGWLYEALTDYLIRRDGIRTLGGRDEARVLELACWFERLGCPHVVDYDAESPEGFFVRKLRRGDSTRNCIKIGT